MEPVITENVVMVALAMALAAAIPALLTRLPVPGVVLEILIGALIGPQVLGLVHPGVVLGFLSQLGLGMLFLMAGFEIEPASLRGRPIRNALTGWIMSLALGFAAAALLASAGLISGWTLVALALTTTTIGALLPVLRDSGLLAPPYGPMILAAGAVGEAGPVVALSLLLADDHASLEALVLVSFAAASVAAVAFAARLRSGRFAGIVDRTIGTSGQLPMRLTVCLLILLAALSNELDIDIVIGAFVAGAVVRAGVDRRHDAAFTARLHGLGSAFLVPIFFVTSGAQLDVRALFAAPGALAMVPLYAVLMLAARGLPALLLYRADLSFRERCALALHSGTQLSLVVAITGVAVARGLMPGGEAAALVGGAILTLLLFPALAQRILGRPRPTGVEESE